MSSYCGEMSLFPQTTSLSLETTSFYFNTLHLQKQAVNAIKLPNLIIVGCSLAISSALQDTGVAENLATCTAFSCNEHYSFFVHTVYVICV